MFSLYYKTDDSILINDKSYEANASFDNILKIIDMINKKNISNVNKFKIGIKMFFGKDTDLSTLSINEQAKIFNDVFTLYANQGKKPEIETDLNGDPLPKTFKKDKENFYSLKHDAKYIYASFMQAYGIDLLDQQGKMHWFKFQALLDGLPEDTKFRQVVSIRTWKKPSKSDTEASQMKKLKEFYRLPDDESEV